MANDSDMVALLDQALGQTFGLKVSSTDPNILKRKLYIVRRNYDRFSCLSFHQSPADVSELWIIHKRVENE